MNNNAAGISLRPVEIDGFQLSISDKPFYITKREEAEFLANFERNSQRDWEKLQDAIREWLGETRKTLGQYAYGGGDDENWMGDEGPLLDDWDDLDEDGDLQTDEN